MKYVLESPSVIHFDYDKNYAGDYNKLKVEFKPDLQIFPADESDFTDPKNIYQTDIRWTFRLYDDEKVVCSYIAEQLCLITFTNEVVSSARLAYIIILSHYSIAFEFDIIKPHHKWIDNISLIGLDGDYIDSDQIDSIVMGMSTQYNNDK